MPFIRPEELATDDAPAVSVVLHCLEYLSNTESYNPDLIAYLEPTTPFKTSKHIDKAIDILLESQADSVVGISEVVQHPYWMVTRSKNDILKEFIGLDDKPERRQKLPLLYWIGALYITNRRYYDHVRPDSLVYNRDSMVGLIMDRFSSFDINDEIDFLIAQALLKSRIDQKLIDTHDCPLNDFRT